MAFKHTSTWREMKRRRNYKYVERVRIEVLTHYGVGGKLCCSWPSCEVTDIDMLHLDHVNNDGKSDRLKRGVLGGYILCAMLRKENYPKGYQTLCANHDRKKASIQARQRRMED